MGPDHSADTRRGHSADGVEVCWRYSGCTTTRRKLVMARESFGIYAPSRGLRTTGFKRTPTQPSHVHPTPYPYQRLSSRPESTFRHVTVRSKPPKLQEPSPASPTLTQLWHYISDRAKPTTSYRSPIAPIPKPSVKPHSSLSPRTGSPVRSQLRFRSPSLLPSWKQVPHKPPQSCFASTVRTLNSTHRSMPLVRASV